MYILLLFFIIFNFIIYHKIFRVIYFDLAKGLSREIFWCILLSPFEAAIVVAVGPYILVAVGVIFAIVLIVKYVSKKKNIDENVSQNNTSNGQKPQSYGAAKNSTQPTYSHDNKYSNIKSEQEENVSENFTGWTDVAGGQKQENIQRESKQDDCIFCPYCGEKILRVAKFCNFCGQANSYGK